MPFNTAGPVEQPPQHAGKHIGQLLTSKSHSNALQYSMANTSAHLVLHLADDLDELALLTQHLRK